MKGNVVELFIVFKKDEPINPFLCKVKENNGIKELL